MSTATVSRPEQNAAMAPALGRSRAFLSRLSDKRLVERVRRGNALAFEVLYDRYSAQLLSFCRHMLGSREEGEDAVQQAFISAYNALAEGTQEINFKPWLFTIARNRSLDIIRARREQPSEFVEPSTDGLSHEVEQRVELRELLRDLHGLPVDQRAALVLSELGGLSHADVAEIVGCDGSKVKALVFQARQTLAQCKTARDASCRDIRSALSTDRGRAARRGPIRRHMRDCPGCAAYWDEIRDQRAKVAALLPVVPTLGLKEQALAAATAGSGGGASGAALLAGSPPAAKFAGASIVVAGTLLAGGVSVIDDGTASPDTDGGPAAPALVKPLLDTPAHSRANEALASAKGVAERERPNVAPDRDTGRERAAERSEPRANKRKPRKPRNEPAPAPGPSQDQPAAQPVTQDAEPGPAHPTPRRTRTRANGGGPSPNASPNAGPPRSPDHPEQSQGNGNAGGNGHGNAHGHDKNPK